MAHATQISLCAGGSVTHLSVKVEGQTPFEAGQYCFLNIPDISTLQWHPFTISDRAEKEGELSFHIKAMGDTVAAADGSVCGTTWTGRLADLAVKGKAAEDIAVSVDGPYGVPVRLDGCSRVVFIAGGIGITPVHAMIRTICASREESRRGIHLVWVVRTESEIGMFTKSLTEMQECGVLLSLFVTKGAGTKTDTETWSDLPISYQPSREIDLRDEIVKGDAQEEEFVCEGRPLVFSCGPAALVERARDCALEEGFDFHSETFEL